MPDEFIYRVGGLAIKYPKGFSLLTERIQGKDFKHILKETKGMG